MAVTEEGGNVLATSMKHLELTSLIGIMTQNRLGPWDSLQKLHPWDYSSSELPEMQKSSDMMWAQWEFYIPENKRHNVQYFITLSIENPTTLALMRRALDARGKDLTRRGERFEMSTDEGKALLCTYLHAQHLPYTKIRDSKPERRRLRALPHPAEKHHRIEANRRGVGVRVF